MTAHPAIMMSAQRIWMPIGMRQAAELRSLTVPRSINSRRRRFSEPLRTAKRKTNLAN